MESTGQGISKQVGFFFFFSISIRGNLQNKIIHVLKFDIYKLPSCFTSATMTISRLSNYRIVCPMLP